MVLKKNSNYFLAWYFHEWFQFYEKKHCSLKLRYTICELSFTRNVGNTIYSSTCEDKLDCELWKWHIYQCLSHDLL